jgi:hypothetical protein
LRRISTLLRMNDDDKLAANRGSPR